MYTKTIIFTLLSSLFLPSLSFSQTPEINSEVSSPSSNAFTSLPKPNFFPKYVIEKDAVVTLNKLTIDENALNDIKVTNFQINSFSDYYLSKTKEYFKNKKIEGAIIVLVEVTAIKPKDDSIVCDNTPTECSLTQKTYIFSDNISNTVKQKYFDYINQQSIKDNMEILIKNFSYENKLRFGFQLSLDNKTKMNILNDETIDKFIANENIIEEQKTDGKTSSL